MGTETMGRVTVAAKIENLGDLYMVEKGAYSGRSGSSDRSERRSGRHGRNDPSMPKASSINSA